MATLHGTGASELLGTNPNVNVSDFVFGHGGNDSIFTFGGNDILKGGGGADNLFGGTGIDTADYSDSFEGVTVRLGFHSGEGGTAEGDGLYDIENLSGSFWNDRLYGYTGANTLDGIGGDDYLNGGSGPDILNGGAGADTLDGGSEGDQLHGGDGIDTIDYLNSPVGVVVSLISNSAAFGHATNDTFTSIENIDGSFHGDELTGDGGNNVLNGEFGDDTLTGLAGADHLIGSFGVDTLIGGPNDDLYTLWDENDTVVEDPNGGVDTVQVTSDYELGQNVENLTLLGGWSGIDGTGNNAPNTITGNEYANTIDGAGGIDTMIGGNGGDTYFVDHGSDVVTEFGGEGADEVQTSVNWVMPAGSDIETLRTLSDAGMAAINLTGNETGNNVIGNNGANVVNGGGGIDGLTGNGGQDHFRFDTMLGAGNVDTIADFVTGIDTIQLENTIFGAFSAGPLADDRFVVGTAALDANDCIIYNGMTGELFYDADGTGAAIPVHFATLTGAPVLTHGDFLIT